MPAVQKPHCSCAAKIHKDKGAFPGQTFGNGATDASASAGHQRNPVGERANRGMRPSRQPLSAGPSLA